MVITEEGWDWASGKKGAEIDLRHQEGGNMNQDYITMTLHHNGIVSYFR